MRSVESLRLELYSGDMQMLRNLESITRDTQSVTGTVGIILMVSIALVAATTLQVYLGQMGGSDKGMTPMIGMIQSGDSLMITSIQFGPIPVDEITFKVFDNDGNHICDGILSASGEHLSAGDTITFSCPPLVHGEAYLVRAICPEGQVGKAEYIA